MSETEPISPAKEVMAGNIYAQLQLLAAEECVNKVQKSLRRIAREFGKGIGSPCDPVLKGLAQFLRKEADFLGECRDSIDKAKASMRMNIEKIEALEKP